MKRNIITTIEFKGCQIAINVLEQLDNNNIEIFNSSDKISNVNLFIKNSLNKINNIIKGKIKDVFIVIEPSQKSDISIELANNKVKILGKRVIKEDIHNLFSLMKEKYKKNNKKIILVHPTKFIVEGIEKKVYKYAPINIQGDYISSQAMITSIELNQYMFIKKIIKLHNLNIIQFFITPQTISNSRLSKNALYNGAFLIQFDNKKIIITYNKDGATKTYFSLYNWGIIKLIKDVAINFNCSEQEAYNLILIYGSLKKPNTEVVIYTNQEGIKEVDYTNFLLYKIMKNFFLKVIIIIKKHINQQILNNLLLVISGKFVKISYILEFFQHILSKNVALYNPVEYLEINSDNIHALGVLKIKNTLNDLTGINLTTSVQTNPNSFECLNKNYRKKDNIFNKIINKLGEKYERIIW